MHTAETPRNLFLSHSSQDSAFATFLASEIERIFDNRVKVFVSSRPDELDSGKEWRPRVIENLGKATTLIVLLTRASESSAWVGFEAGYFWHKTAGENIHILRHHQVAIPNPIDVIQAKLLTSEDELASFFSILSQALGDTRTYEVNLSEIVAKANTIEARIPERSLRYFERMLGGSSWEKLLVERTPSMGEIVDLFSHGRLYDDHVATHNEVWVCTDDAILQIIRDDSTRDKFTEEWIKNLPIYQLYQNKEEFAYSYSVYLTISGARIKAMTFINLDGGRYFIPLPSIKSTSIDPFIENSPRKFVWRRDSIEYKVGLVIGELYNTNSLDDFAHSVGFIVE